MSAVFDTRGEEGRCGCGHTGCYRKRWGEWGGIVECWVLETLPLVLYEQTTTVICEYEMTNEGIIWGMYFVSTKANGL